MKTVVFLGPSLPQEEARRLLDAVYLPPAGQADVISALTTHRPECIAIIDGVFAQSLSVWHKEILYAISKGVHVLGAASMGAIRAAELDRLGMVGVGEVYRLFASGELTDDDEVAVAHGPAESGYRLFSEPMVNLRLSFDAAGEAGVLDDHWRERLTVIAKALYFPERTLPRILAAASAEGMAPEVVGQLRSFLRTGYVDVKADDARRLLLTVAQGLSERPAEPPAFVATQVFRAQYERDRTVRHDDVDVSLASIANHAALHLSDFPDLNFNALNRGLVCLLAESLDVDVDEVDVDLEDARCRRRHRVEGEEALGAWLADNDLDRDEYRRLLHDVALCRRLHRWMAARLGPRRNTQHVLDEMRLHGLYPTWAASAAARERILTARHSDLHFNPPQESVAELLMEHVRETGLRIDARVEDWIQEAGLWSSDELGLELWAAKLVREERRKAAGLLEVLVGPEAGEDA